MRESWRSHDGLSPSRGTRRKTQQSWRARKDSCRVLDQGRVMRESWGAITDSVRVKEQGVRFSKSLENRGRLMPSPEQGEP